MKKNRTIAKFATMMFAMFITTTTVLAQTSKPKVEDKELIGVWIMESMQFEGSKKMMCGDDYSQIKVYRANGEYACAEIAADGNDIMILPHEYGTYTMKNGKYTECGRPGTTILIDKTHFEGQWNNRHDHWRKVTNLPDNLVDYIVDKCKRKTDPKDIQALTKKLILTTPNK